MFWVWFFIIAAVYITFIWLLEKGLIKLFNVNKQKVSDSDGKMVDRWCRAMMLIVSLSILIFYIIPLMENFKENITIIKWYWLLHFGIIIGFQSFMEWKYLRPSKQYLTTLILQGIFLVIPLYFLDYFILSLVPQ